jgi:hypothetical protein
VAGSVAHFRYADLPRLPRNPQLPFPFHETHPPRFVPEWAAADNDPVGGDTRIPLLEDVFAAFPDAVINIDVSPRVKLRACRPGLTDRARSSKRPRTNWRWL